METQLPMLFVQNIFVTCWIYVGSARVPVFRFLQDPVRVLVFRFSQGPGFPVFVGSRWDPTRVPDPGFLVCCFILFLTIKYLRMFNMSRAKIRLDKDVLKTSSRRLHQDEYNRHTYSSWPYIFKKSSRRFRDIFKTSCKSIFKTSSKRLEDILKMSCKNVFKTCPGQLQDVSKMYSRHPQEKHIIKLNCSC